jgi:CheY-like chemotaxis protein
VYTGFFSEKTSRSIYAETINKHVRYRLNSLGAGLCILVRRVIGCHVPATTPTVWRVLLVDDDPLVSDSIRRMLEFDQRQVQCVTSGAEALCLCEKQDFDVVLVDYLMPVMKGDVLAIKLKELCPNLPIIMITADADKLAPTVEPPAGVDLLIGKPFQFDALREAVNKVVAKV